MIVYIEPNTVFILSVAILDYNAAEERGKLMKNIALQRITILITRYLTSSSTIQVSNKSRGDQFMVLVIELPCDTKTFSNHGDGNDPRLCCWLLNLPMCARFVQDMRESKSLIMPVAERKKVSQMLLVVT